MNGSFCSFRKPCRLRTISFRELQSFVLNLFKAHNELPSISKMLTHKVRRRAAFARSGRQRVTWQLAFVGGNVTGDDGKTRDEYRECGYYKPNHYSFSNCSKRLIKVRNLYHFVNFQSTRTCRINKSPNPTGVASLAGLKFLAGRASSVGFGLRHQKIVNL